MDDAWTRIEQALPQVDPCNPESWSMFAQLVKMSCEDLGRADADWQRAFGARMEIRRSATRARELPL